MDCLQLNTCLETMSGWGGGISANFLSNAKDILVILRSKTFFKSMFSEFAPLSLPRQQGFQQDEHLARYNSGKLVILLFLSISCLCHYSSLCIIAP